MNFLKSFPVRLIPGGSEVEWFMADHCYGFEYTEKNYTISGEFNCLKVRKSEIIIFFI